VEKLFIVIQYIIPQHLLSRLVGILAETKVSWLKNFLIKQFIRAYNVNMGEAIDPTPENYVNFNTFFTRAIKPDVRPITSDKKQLACPVDGAISQLGEIKHGRVFQAKGQDYSLTQLLGSDSTLAQEFMDGQFATIYLSPKDYHRVHMPITGTLREMIYVPGKLFSVNPATTRNVPALFARNERAVCIFDTEIGPMAMILVGAMIVAGIETVWTDTVTPPQRTLKTTRYTEDARQPIVLEKGEEMGRFKLGSTVVLLFGKDAINWQEKFKEDSPTRLGEALADITG